MTSFTIYNAGYEILKKISVQSAGNTAFARETCAIGRSFTMISCNLLALFTALKILRNNSYEIFNKIYKTKPIYAEHKLA